MSAKKIAAKKIATTEAPALEAPMTEAPMTEVSAEAPMTEVSAEAPEAPAAAPEAPAAAPEAPAAAPEATAAKPSRAKKAVVEPDATPTVAEFIGALMSEYFTPQIVDFWGPQVADNIGRGIPVAITKSAEGAPLLDIRYGHSYRGAAEKSETADFNIDVNAAVLAKFPDA